MTKEGPTTQAATTRCQKCKTRKCRCSRTLPTCEACEKGGYACVYDPVVTEQAGQAAAPRDVSSPAARHDSAAALACDLALRDCLRHLVAPPAELPLPVARLVQCRRGSSNAGGQARAARQALTKTLAHGGAAPLEKVHLDGIDCHSLSFELHACDETYSVSGAASTLLFSSAPATAAQIDSPTGRQTHACLSMYFARIEPTLLLFAPASAKDAFQAACVHFWTTGVSPEAKGWAAQYVACMAMGAMAMAEDEWSETGMHAGREETAREWANEARRLLTEEGCLRSPSLTGKSQSITRRKRLTPALPGLRASLFVIHFHLLGFGSTPDLPTIVYDIRLVLQQAFELDLHLELDARAPDAKERWTMWMRVFELETSWGPLIGTKSTLDPATFSARLSSPCARSGPLHARPSDYAPPSIPHVVLSITARLTRLLALPHTPSSLDLFLLAGEFSTITPLVCAPPRSCPLAALLLHVGVLRVHAALVEAGAAMRGDEQASWADHADGLLASNPLECPQAFHLLAVTLFLHGAILVALCLRQAPNTVSPATASSLSTRPLAVLHTLRTSAWPIVVHLTVQRGIIVLQRLVQVEAMGLSRW